jgi:hypothetical protein
MTTVNQLLERGYFPRELPPPLNTKQFAAFVVSAQATIPPRPRRAWTQCVDHNLGRPGGLRRRLGIPNPQAYFHLARAIESHWSALYLHTRSALSCSRPIPNRKGERALLPAVRYNNLPKIRARRRRGARYILTADITQFYQSLYTHSIPWAMHTKAVAKASRGNLIGDTLDARFRDLRHGQTTGIPIGPDSSLLAAEVVLSAADKELAALLGSVRGFRYSDDYELSFATLGAAEQALIFLEGVLADFELTVNHPKSTIDEVPIGLQPSWVTDLRTFPVEKGGTSGTLNDVVAFFSHALELARMSRNEGILKYATLRAREFEIGKSGWRTFEGLVLAAVSADPTVLPVALDLLNTQSSRVGTTISRLAVADVLEPMILRHAALRNGSEVAWAIWTGIELRVDFSSEVASAVASVEDDIVALVALDARRRGRFPTGLDTSVWRRLVNDPKGLVGPHWLLTYESQRKGWLTSGRVAVRADPFFSMLNRAQVGFYDATPKRRPFTGTAGPEPGWALPAWYV